MPYFLANAKTPNLAMVRIERVDTRNLTQRFLLSI